MTATELPLLHASDFSPLLHQRLVIRFGGTIATEAELIEVKETPNYPDAERQPFFILFRTDQKDPYYPQAIHVLEHPQKCDLLLFLVPVGPDGKGMRYEAVFS